MNRFHSIAASNYQRVLPICLCVKKCSKCCIIAHTYPENYSRSRLSSDSNQYDIYNSVIQHGINRFSVHTLLQGATPAMFDGLKHPLNKCMYIVYVYIYITTNGDGSEPVYIYIHYIYIHFFDNYTISRWDNHPVQAILGLHQGAIWAAVKTRCSSSLSTGWLLGMFINKWWESPKKIIVSIWD